MNAPRRTCAGCGRTAPKAELVRFVARDGVLTPDPRGTAPGRGVYAHRDPGCLEQATVRRAFARRLRTDVRVPPGLNLFSEED